MALLRFAGLLVVVLVLATSAQAQQVQDYGVIDESAPLNSEYYSEGGATYDDGGSAVASDGGLPVPVIPEQRIPSLQYNYYYPMPEASAQPARLYLCPRPVPERVGYTYITYQAFSPHEFLYHHARSYVSVHPHNITYTRIRWY